MSAQAELQKLNKLNAVSYQRFVRAFKMVQAAQDKSCETDLVTLMDKVDTSNRLEYNHLMHILTKVRYKPVLVSTAGINLLDRMRKRGIYPDTVTYTSFINLLKKDRNADKAWLVFRRMREEKVRPNEWTYSTMAHICALKRNATAAEELLGLMEEDRVVPNFVVMAGFVDAFLAAGKVERTWELIDSMRKRHRVRPNNFTLDYILKSTLRESKEWDAWVEQHREASATAASTRPPAESGTESGEAGATSSVSEREGSDAVSKKLERVKLVLRFLRREYGLAPSTKTFNALIARCTKGKRTDIELAWRLKRLMKAYRLRPDNVTYVPLLNYYVKQLKARSKDSDIDYAEPQQRPGDEGGEEGEEERTDGDSDESGSSADADADGPGVEEPYDGIRRTLQDMQDEGVESDPATTFTLIIDAHAASGDADQCFGAYADMRRDQVMPTVATYATLLRFCEKHGNLEKARELWEDIKADQIRLPWNVVCSLLRAALTNETDTAFRLAEELSQSYKPQLVYSQLLTICDQRADVWQAERVWRVMRAKEIPIDARTKRLLNDFGLNTDEEAHHT